MAGRQLRRYSPEEIDLGLRTLALEGGNSQAAHERLKEGGLDIPSVTLRDWRNTSRVERYQDICVQVAPEIERVVVQRSAEIQRRALDVSLKAIDAAEQQITTGSERPKRHSQKPCPNPRHHHRQNPDPPRQTNQHRPYPRRRDLIAEYAKT